MDKIYMVKPQKLLLVDNLAGGQLKQIFEIYIWLINLLQLNWTYPQLVFEACCDSGFSHWNLFSSATETQMAAATNQK